MVRYLQSKPEASFDEVREASEDAGFTIYPATFGRAQAIAGIIEANPRPIITSHVVPPTVNAPTPKTIAEPTASAGPTPLMTRSSLPTPELSPEVAFQVFFKAFQQRRAQRTLIHDRVGAMLEIIDHALEE
jgi:hypothetical protein